MKNLQLLRNSNIYTSKSAAKTALEGLSSSTLGDMADGTPVIARYSDNGDVKTLLGIVHQSDDTYSVTVFDSNPDLNGEMIKMYDGDTIEVNPPYSYKNDFFNPSAITSADTVASGFDTLQGNVDALAGVVLDNEEVTCQSIIALADAAGTKDSDGKVAYIKNTDANYISDAESLAEADNKLDAAIKGISNSFSGYGKTLNYDSTTKKIQLKNGDTVLSDIDATDFIKDGMIDTVAWSTVEGEENILVITWNTDAGKEVTKLDFGKFIDLYDTDNVKVGSGFTTITGYNEALTDVSVIASGDTTSLALHKVESALSRTVDEVVKNEEVTEKAIEKLAEAAGTQSTDGTISYVQNNTANYISEAESLSDADNKLDAAIKAVDDKIDSNTLSGDTCIEVTSDKKIKLNHTVAESGAGLKDVDSTDGKKQLDVTFDFGTW